MTGLIDAEPVPRVPEIRRVRHNPLWLRRLAYSAAVLGATAAGCAAIWRAYPPGVTVQARIMPDPADTSDSRVALANAALRIGQPAARLAAGGQELVLSAHEPTMPEAQRQAQSMVDALLNTQPAPASLPPVPPVPDDRGPLRAERASLQAAIDAADQRAAALSQSLTGLARDLSASGRIAADRRPGREVLQKAEAALAEATLQRIQLQSRYQDDFPAIVALDVQIKRLRSFLADEQRRLDTPPGADPVLTAERDRLRAEQTLVDERRKGLVASLAAVDQSLGAPAPVAVVAAAAAPPAVLLQGAMTAAPDPDLRQAILPPLALGGVFLAGLAALLPRRRAVPAYGALRLRLVQDRHAALPPNEGAIYQIVTGIRAQDAGVR